MTENTSTEAIADETKGVTFGIDVQMTPGFPHTGMVGVPELGKLTTIIELDGKDANGDPVDHAFLHVATDMFAANEGNLLQGYDDLADMLSDLADALRSSRGQVVEMVEADLQATGPGGETVDEDAK